MPPILKTSFRKIIGGLLPALVLAGGVRPSMVAADPVYVFSHLAGPTGGGHGFADGTGAAASFWFPNAVAADSAGNVYVADWYNDTIRKITPGGVVTTLAGSPGQSGSADGTGGAAHFDRPTGVAVDRAGTVYVADTYNYTIRKITPGGVVTTLAGSPGSWGSDDGSGATARFDFPTGLAVDGAGVVYVTDSYTATIRKITPEGVVSTLAGAPGQSGSADGSGATARFDQPRSVAVDSAGNVYVCDNGNDTIRKITPAGLVTTLAGTAGQSGSADGTGAAARFDDANGLAVDSAGNLFVADGGNSTIRKITPGGVVTTLAGTAGRTGSDDGTGTAAQFTNPRGVGADSAGNVYVADTSNDTIRKITPDGGVTTLAGRAGQVGSTDGTGVAARFNFPFGVAVDNAGNTYVADGNNYTVRKIAPSGAVSTLAGSAGLYGTADGTGGGARFDDPHGVAVDDAGNVYVADAWSCTVRKITPAGKVTTLAGTARLKGSADGTGAAARFYWPQGIAVDRAGNVYVADAGNYTIRKIAPDGVVTTLAGTVGQSGSVDGTGAAARFYWPAGLAVDAGGSLYVADSKNHTVRKITPDGAVTTLAGTAGHSGKADGTGASVLFHWPCGVAVDGAGNVYVTTGAGYDSVGAFSVIEDTNPTVRRIAPDGTVTTLVDAVPILGVNRAGGAAIRFYGPTGVASDRNGVLYVSDISNNAIWRGTTVAAGQLVNISSRALGGTGNNVTIGGFVIGGSGAKRVLVRAVGPTLTSQGIGPAEVMLDPTIELHDALKNNDVIANVDNWGENANAGEITTVASQLGAAALLGADAKSAAVLLTLQPGVYSFVARGKADTSGIVLVETYDADTVVGQATVVNISTRAYCATGNGVSIGGFVVSGNAPKRLLLRAVGPTLTTQGIDVAEVLRDPTIEVHDAMHGNVVVATNDNWGENANAADIVTTGARVGATPLARSDTKSAVLLVTLQPGVYSFIAGGKANSSGVVLIEVYDAD